MPSFGYSSRYHIGADLAGSVYDIALAEGIEPELAFRLVKVESDFNEHASSSAGALGLTQVMPSTAQFFVPGITTMTACTSGRRTCGLGYDICARSFASTTGTSASRCWCTTAASWPSTSLATGPRPVQRLRAARDERLSRDRDYQLIGFRVSGGTNR